MSASKRSSGNWNPDWESFARLDPAWTEKALALVIDPAISGALDPRTVALIGIALDASCTRMYEPGIRRNVRRALAAGATREEILAVLQLAVTQGMNSMCLAAPILVDELGARRRKKKAKPRNAKETP